MFLNKRKSNSLKEIKEIKIPPVLSKINKYTISDCVCGMNRSRLVSAVTKYQTAGKRNAGPPLAPFWTRTGLATKVLGGMVVVVVVVVVAAGAAAAAVAAAAVVVFGCVKAEIIGALVPLDCVTRNVTWTA
jgi:hypothetical protein